MPHCDLKYSDELAIDPAALLAGVEAILQRHDPGSGDCKGRAYPARVAHHAHLIAEVSLLPKTHRDAAFMAALRTDLAEYLRANLPRPCWMSLNVALSGPDYITEHLT